MARPPLRFAVVGLGDIAQRAVLPAFEHARGKEPPTNARVECAMRLLVRR